MHAVRDATSRASALLIVDEVMTSRNGPHGMQEMLDLRGDLMTVGKYLAGGLSFGAFGGRSDVMSIFDPGNPRAVPHSGTFNNNIASMAAGRVVVDTLYSAEIASEHTARGDELREQIQRLLERTGAQLSITGSGSLMNLHGTRARITRPEALTGAEDRLKTLMFLFLLEHGFYIAPRGYIALSLALTDEDRSNLIAALEMIIDENPVLAMAGPSDGI
jgi:glutamate-1-semialdehyde 2,1-aminomutase